MEPACDQQTIEQKEKEMKIHKLMKKCKREKIKNPEIKKEINESSSCNVETLTMERFLRLDSASLSRFWNRVTAHRIDQEDKETKRQSIKD